MCFCVVLYIRVPRLFRPCEKKVVVRNAALAILGYLGCLLIYKNHFRRFFSGLFLLGVSVLSLFSEKLFFH